eukprot:403370919
MYMAFNSASNIQSVVMNEDGFGQLGFYILAILYLFMGIGSLISTAIINKLGSRNCFIIGGLGNVQWIFSTILAAEQKDKMNFDGSQKTPSKYIVGLLFFSTMLNGLTVGILWACANNYVARCASEQNKGFAFSYFWSFYMCSQIIGNFVAAFTLGKFSQITFFMVMGIVALCGTGVFWFLSEANHPGDSMEIHDAYKHEHKFSDDIKSVLELLQNKRMRMLLPQLCWTGISIAVYTGLLVPTIVSTLPDASEQEQFQHSMITMVALGFGEIIGANVQGKIVDKIGTKPTCIINVILILMSTIFVMNYLYVNKYTPFAFVMTFMWGFQDSAVSIHLNSILGFEFEGNSEPFSIDALIEAIMVFTFQMIQSTIISNKAHFLYISVVGVLGMSMTITTFFFDFRESKQINEGLSTDDLPLIDVSNKTPDRFPETHSVAN